MEAGETDVYTLTFDRRHAYPPDAAGITLPVLIKLGERQVRLFAKADTGASFCIFRREYGEMLGLDIEGGTRQQVATVTGSFATYGHAVTLVTADYEFDTTVYFAAERDHRRNVLGRQGWLEQVRLGIIDYDRQLYLSRYDD